MSAAIYATIGSMANVSISPNPNQRISPNSFAKNVSMRVTLKNCTVYAVSHMTNHSSIFVAINARIGSTAAAWVFCRVRPTVLMSISARIVSEIIR